MLYFTMNKGELIKVSDEPNAKSAHATLCRWDFPTMSDAEAMAVKATALTGKLHIAADAGEWTSPRYDVIAAPVVGAEVSRYFNGDAYPAGKIKTISKTLKKITTDTGVTFYRVRESGAWLNEGTWSMVSGVRHEQNPSF